MKEGRREGRALPPDSSSPEPMELEPGDVDDFSQGVLRQEDPPLRIQPHRKCKLRAKPTPLDQGMRELTAADCQRLFRQASAAYKAAQRERQEAGINVFIPTASPHFETNEKIPLDTNVFHYACHRLQFTPDLDLFANSENAQVTRFLSAYPMTRSCGVNAFNYNWSEDAGHANHPNTPPPSLSKTLLRRCTSNASIPRMAERTMVPRRQRA